MQDRVRTYQETVKRGVTGSSRLHKLENAVSKSPMSFKRASILPKSSVGYIIPTCLAVGIEAAGVIFCPLLGDPEVRVLFLAIPWLFAALAIACLFIKGLLHMYTGLFVFSIFVGLVVTNRLLLMALTHAG